MALILKLYFYNILLSYKKIELKPYYIAEYYKMKRRYSEIRDDEPPEQKKRFKRECILDFLNNHLDTTTVSNSWLLIGMTGSGKSYLANKFIAAYGFNKRYYFSPTPEPINFYVDRHYKGAKLEIDIIKDLFEKQKQYHINRMPMPRIQIIINDYASCLKNKAIKEELESLATTGRHYMIDTIILVQNFKSIPTVIRSNVINNIYFGTSNKNELRTIDSFGYETPKGKLGNFIRNLKRYEYILQIQSKVSGKVVFIKCKDLDVLEYISDISDLQVS